MKKLYILIFTLLLFTGVTLGQTVKGHVYDAETHEPLPGVNITYKKINGDTNGTISDTDGAYEIALPDGGVDLLFSYIGYENERLPLMLRKGDIKTKDVYMHIKANLLGDVVISAGRFEQKLSDVTVSMDLLKAGDIAKQAPTDLSSTLNTMPGVDINDKQPSIRGGNGWTIRGRFAQPCAGGRHERPEFGQRSDQLEHRPARKHRTGRSDEGCLLRTLRLIGSERGDQYPHETAGTHADYKRPSLCRGLRPSGS